MTETPEASVICQICKNSKHISDVKPAQVIREPLVEIIKKTYPDWTPDGYICSFDLNRFREEYVKDALAKGKREVSVLEEQVVKSLKEHEFLSADINAEFNQKLTFGQRMADKMADQAGSWRFIIIFSTILGIWIFINAVILMVKPFDPYPFILLNLILSTIAALQAPLIMMSQNRQEEKDRLRAENDYRINLKSELEIRHLHEKMDHLLVTQWQRLLEIQELQTELLQEMACRQTNGFDGHVIIDV